MIVYFPFSKSMNARIQTLIAIMASLLCACTTAHPPLQQQNNTLTEESETKPEHQPDKQQDNYDTSINPPLTIIKGNKTLNLVRIMDGGICKNEMQGATGSFLVYADPQDLERIKREKPKEIFKDFEAKIQNLSAHALEVAIDQTNLALDPFSLGEDVMQEKLAAQLTENFRSAAFRLLSDFRQETTLNIDVMPFPSSLIIYQKGCHLNHIEP